MAISNVVVGTSQEDVFVSSGASAVTFLSLCNLTTNTLTVNLYLVPAATSVTDASLVLKNLQITSEDTYEFYQGGEKIILDNGDRIVVESSEAASLAVVVSSVGV